MTTAAFLLLRHAAENREQWLHRFYEIGQEAVRPVKAGELFGFKIRMDKNARPLLDILETAGVEIKWVKGETAGEVTLDSHPDGSEFPSQFAVVPLRQPYGAFAKALLERQQYPDHRDPTGHPIPPYDVTAQTLPLLMNVEVQPVSAPFKTGYLAKARLSILRPACSPTGKKVGGLYRSSVPSMDEGWTRWIFDRCTEYESLTDAQIRQGNLGKTFKWIVIPDQAARTILNGHRPGAMPPEYTGGLGTDGVNALREFVEHGGTLTFFNRAADFAIEQFRLPIRNVVAGLPRTDFYVPGSILRTELDLTHPLTKGMPRESIAWVEESPVFEVHKKEHSSVDPENVRVIARYPFHQNPLLSGWLLGGDRIKGKAALVEVKMGQGRLILFGFRPQYRAQSLATYPLLFNAIATQ